MHWIAAFLCPVFSTTKDLISKGLSKHIDGTLSTFASFAFALPFYFLALAILVPLGWERLVISAGFIQLLIYRSITDSLAEGFKMHAFAWGDLSVVTAFFSLAPLFTLVLSPWMTGDPLSLAEVLAIGLAVLGSLIMAIKPRTGEARSQTRGILLALAAALFFSLNSCFDRLAARNETPVVSAFGMTLFSAVILLPFAWRQPDGMRELNRFQRSLWMRGLFEILFMVGKLIALQALTAPQMIAIQRLSVLLSILAGRLIFKEKNFGRRLVAGLFIVVGVMLIGLQTQLGLDISVGESWARLLRWFTSSPTIP